jgi:uncharacterized membrane protein YjgN (DUF898 family)
MTGTVSPPVASSPSAPVDLPVRFHGSAKEYFRIWIVNLCLTLLSVGVFSAWAKVRKKRYFYSHTTLDGTPFQYLGQPLPILKGRIIAAVLFGVYYASSHLYTSLMPYVLVAGVVLAPWVIVRSAAFNARYSAFRNMTFHFGGTYKQVLRDIYLWGLVPLLLAASALSSVNGNLYGAAGASGIFGLMFPWWYRRLKKFLVQGTAFGGEHGELTATGGQFYKIYFLGGLIVTLTGVVSGVIVAALVATRGPGAMMTRGATFLMVPVYAGYVVAYAYMQARIANLVWNKTALGPLRFRSTLRARGLAGLYFTNALGIIASLGLLTPWAVIRTLQYRATNMHVQLDGKLASFHGSDRSAVQATGAELSEFFDLDLSI